MKRISVCIIAKNEEYFLPGCLDAAWIGADEAPDDFYGCTDMFGLNYNADATADDGSCD